jgi:mRNA-degrading endonuclease RelE of RelBE toxin-antitoxin system
MLLKEAQPPLTINPVHITNRSVMEITQNCVKARTFGKTSADKTLRQIQRLHIKPFVLFYLYDSHHSNFLLRRVVKDLPK